jgi:hypothetical protein
MQRSLRRDTHLTAGSDIVIECVKRFDRIMAPCVPPSHGAAAFPGSLDAPEVP